MLAISVELLHGTFRGDPDGTAITGRLTRGEWPPSPARLFAALVAADGTRQACRVTDGSELVWFERLPPPVIHASPSPWHQPLEPRYVVKQEGELAKDPRSHQLRSHQEYIGRTGVLSRAGVRVTPPQPHVVYSWPVLAPPQATLEALQRRAARVGYLGGSDSPVRLRVATQLPAWAAQHRPFTPDEQGDHIIRVPATGDLDILDRMYDDWKKRGPSATRAQFPALQHGARYRSPGFAEELDKGGVVAWLRLDQAVSGRRIATITALFKEAVLSQHQRLYGEPPAVLHGHGFDGRGYEIARYLALPDVGFRWSRGRIFGLALWMPPGCDLVEREKAADAAKAIRRLSGRAVDVSVAPSDEEERPLAVNPDRWRRKASGWATAFPAIHERRRTLDLAEVTRWCRHAGLPNPVAFRAARTPLVPGAVDLAPIEVNRPGRPGLPYCHVELRFGTPIPGPVVIGSGRQRGFGLCVPLDERGRGD